MEPPTKEHLVDPAARLTELAVAWEVDVERIVRTPTSLVAFGARDGAGVVLKVVTGPHEEWDAGAVVAAFDGRGMVHALERRPGAVLLERARPGTPLVELVRDGRDDKATDVLLSVVRAMLEAEPSTAGFAAAESWGEAFDRYLARDGAPLPPALVEDARDRYRQLCCTQSGVRLLHGDLQHYNVIRDAERGWLAIDPKGVVAEVEFELGAMLRNPPRMPELYTAAAIGRRVARIGYALDVDAERVVGWAFAQAVLSALWSIEDEGEVDPDGPALRVARSATGLLA